MERAAQADIMAVFARRGWLAAQPAAFRALVIAKGRLLDYARHSPVYHEGDSAGGIYGVVSGGIGVLVGNAHLSPRTAHVLRAGDWFGSGPILHGGTRSMGFTAVEPSQVLVLERVALRDLGPDPGETMRRIGMIANMGADMGAQVAATLLIPQGARRVAAILLRVTAVSEGISPDRDAGFLLPQTLIAEMSAMSRNLVNLSMGQFRREGWIATSYHHVRILAPAPLADFAYGEGSYEI